jgi:hypothetical protein
MPNELFDRYKFGLVAFGCVLLLLAVIYFDMPIALPRG